MPPRHNIDYSSPQHAGEPHRGPVTQAEQDYVQANLPAVNERLARSRMRMIDPSDPKLARRFGFSQKEDFHG